MIRDGHHREATYWIGIIHTWSQKAFQNDAPADVREEFELDYRGLLGALGIDTDDDVEARMVLTQALISESRQAANDITASNPAITS